ncbi:uncharacterized protein FTOL_08296 [Fusarium torulosum]|uniref:Uncharacterized protein n=1 Tax=Fusarium torulosum TaxID=33205 RepID=A0AAE8MCJ0_9HYPO|nr:uncharacterized protein FTOL_08296 [Fusarium torulosum]
MADPPLLPKPHLSEPVLPDKKRLKNIQLQTLWDENGSLRNAINRDIVLKTERLRPGHPPPRPRLTAKITKEVYDQLAYLEINLTKITTDQMRQAGHLASGFDAAKTEATEAVTKLEMKKQVMDELLSKQNTDLRTLEQDIKARFLQDARRDSGIEVDSDRPSVLNGLHSALEITARNYLGGARNTHSVIPYSTEDIACNINNARQQGIDAEAQVNAAQKRGQ